MRFSPRTFRRKCTQTEVRVFDKAIVHLRGQKTPKLTPEDYLKLLAQLNWEPRVEMLNG